MTGLLFAHPEWLSPLLAGWITVALALGFAIARGRRRLRALLGAAADARFLATRRPLFDAAPLFAAALIAIALLGPRGGERIVQLSTSGVDVVLLLDASRSMDALDVPPSRLDAARAVAAKVLAGLRSGDRAALAAFAGRGVLLTPLTPDHAALQETLSAIDTSLVRPGGSDVAAGVDAALLAFEPGDNRPRAIFVISDGEVTGRAGASFGAVGASRADVRVFAAAIGTETGASIPDHGAPLRDASGGIVTSRLRTATLAALADKTGGTSFVADEWGRIDVDTSLAKLRGPVAANAGEFAPHRVTVPIVLPFAAAAFALLLCDWLPFGVLYERRTVAHERRAAASNSAGRDLGPSPVVRRGSPGSRATVATVALTCLLLVGADEPERATARGTGSARAPGRSVLDGPSMLRAGFALAERGAWAEAEHAFVAAAVEGGSGDTAAVAYHNLGVAALERDDLETARDAFFDALAASPTDPERRRRTQWNLEWVIGRLAAAAEPEPPARDEPEVREKERDESEAEAREGREGREGRKEPERGAAQEAQPPAPRPPADVETTDDPLRRAAGAAPAADDVTLDEAQRRQWLGRVVDDPRRAMLSAAFGREDARDPRPDGSPTW